MTVRRATGSGRLCRKRRVRDRMCACCRHDWAPTEEAGTRATTSNGFMAEANRMFGCGRMFQSPPKFNEKPSHEQKTWR
jgi:hypothetical protein